MKNLEAIAFWSIVTMGLTIVHHFYGAYIYDEPFRKHVAIFALPVVALLLATYTGQLLAKDFRLQRVLRIIFLTAALIFSVIAIGVYEGGYNHVIKNVLYFSGVSTELLDFIYPAVYELPNDFIFELTGVVQFFAGLTCAFFLFRRSKAKTVSV